jgi:K+-transporting ATPase ATPase C chain
MPSITSQLRPALIFLAILTLVFGVLYPAAARFIMRSGFQSEIETRAVHDKAGRAIALPWLLSTSDDPRNFWGGVPTADAACLSNKALPSCKTALQARALALQASGTTYPTDLMEFSAAGYAPRISPETALFQIVRIAKARGIAESSLTALVNASVHNPTYTLAGKPYVNVAELNLRLDGKLQ